MTKYFVPVFLLICVIYTIVSLVTGHFIWALVMGSVTTYNIVMTIKVAKHKLSAEKDKELR